MAEPIMLMDTSDIREGRLDDVRSAVGDLVAFVEDNEPRVIAYDVWISSDRTMMTVTQIHPDVASLELHMEIAAPAFAKLKDMIDLRSMHVFGDPSPKLLEQLRRKAALLGDATVEVHTRAAGLDRIAP